MFDFVPNTNDTYDLVGTGERSCDSDPTTYVTRLTIEELGEITLAAVSVVNPAMGDMLRNLMVQNS
jgi:hypothetical protein